MSLNTEQKKIFNDVINFMNDPNNKYMEISGSAGSGKTYIIAYIVNNIFKHINKTNLNKIAVTATTNKAVAVIKEALIGYTDVSTIHSFMNLRVSENFSTGIVKCIPTAKWDIHTNTLLIIDESSMIDSILFKYLQKGLNNTCKIIFVGDKNQLAPVKESISPIYMQGYPSANLTKPVRNSNQIELVKLCEQVKQTVITGKFITIIPVPGVIDQISGQQLKGLLEREYHKEDSTKRVIAYTNKKVIEYNTFIRSIRGYIEPFKIGEILSNNVASEISNKVRLYTDQMFIIKDILSVKLNNEIIKGENISITRLIVKDLINLQDYEFDVFTDTEIRTTVIKYYAARKQWDKYFHFKNNYPDLRPIAASTVHKAQGSTYDSVIVDVSDIGKSTNKEQTARLLYVALSRAKERVYIRGQLPERYFE